MSLIPTNPLEFSSGRGLKRLLLAAAAVLAPAAALADPAQPVLAAGPEAALAVGPAAADASTVQELVVTGLRGGEKRTVTDSPAPIDVVRGQELVQTGKVGLKEVLNELVPSFNLPGINGGGTSWTVRAITLRGLNGDQALFLVNGKRRHTTALINNLARVGNGGVPVDLDLIPVDAIDHIEVLRDGAAAQYGSDAIAGVINIILKSGANGGQVDVTGGQNYAGDGTTGHVAGDFGVALPNDGVFHFAFDAKASGRASRQINATLAQVYNPLFDAATGKYDISDPRNATVDRSQWGHGYGPGEEQIYSSSYNAELPLNENFKAYSFATLSYRNSRKNTGSFLPNDINSLPEIYPNGFNAERRIFEVDYQVTGGVKGQAVGWDWDLSSSYGRDGDRLDAQNTLNATLGPTSPTSFHLADQNYDQWTNTLDVSRDVQGPFGHPITVAVGAEQRWERYQIQPGDPLSYAVGDYVIPSGYYAGQHPRPGLASYNGTSPAESGSASRNNFAGYVDLSTNLTSKWYLGAAGRFEHYTEGVGDTASGKVSTRYEFLPGFAFRGTVSNGFRAPSLAQTIYASNTISGQVAPDGTFLLIPTKVLPVDSSAAQALGAQPLKPEKSINYSAGFTADPGHGVTFTVDAYEIRISDRILQTGLLRSAGIDALLAPFGLPPGSSAQFFTNAVSTRTRGVDAVLAYDRDLGDLGNLRLSAAYSWNKTAITHFNPTPAPLVGMNLVLFDRQRQGDLTVATPRDKFILSADWKVWRFNVDARVTRYGTYTEIGTPSLPSTDRTFSAKWISDLDVSYDVTKSTTVGVGANNLFDVYPDRIGIIDPKTGMGQYGNFSPFGITGGFYYARLTQRF
ncbi:MAG: TonB-dependent receptor [Caulobacteraceae bacterium]